MKQTETIQIFDFTNKYHDFDLGTHFSLSEAISTDIVDCHILYLYHQTIYSCFRRYQEVLFCGVMFELDASSEVVAAYRGSLREAEVT